MASFEIIGDIAAVEVIASGRGVHRSRVLRNRYGCARRRKLKGVANVLGEHGETRRAEVHWYEAHGVGRRGMKIKRFLD